MNECFRTPESYNTLLYAMVNGHNRISELAAFSGYPKNKCDKYIKSLFEFGLVRKAPEKNGHTKYYPANSYIASDIWQIHPFGEGNTRATAVFMIKYMETLGFHTNSAVFGNSAWYFRNALVRANYNNIPKGIYSTTKYLDMFFSNLLLDTDYELKNRYMHIDYMDSAGISGWK